ncbi:MAG: hypothetical protein IBX62_00180 [Coriobacteriia bacterium]|nr:hypothetical protein [Coriobacteriia bacterium]
MVHKAPALPHGHGEVLTSPAFAEWAELMRRNARAARAWRFDVFGADALALRRDARRDALAAAEAFSARVGVPLAVPSEPAHIVATGHQPEFYHPGVWIKVFLLQRLADETGAAALDMVVDSDAFDALGVTAPVVRGKVERRREHLAVGGRDVCYACAGPPSAEELEAFCSAGLRMLSTLPNWAVARHFGDFCDALRESLPGAVNLAELVTFARRRYEAQAGTDYLELPVTAQSATAPFLRFVAHVATEAERFATGYNAELASFRAATKSRSEAQPFPDLQIGGGFVELPLWHLEGGRRDAVRVRVGEETELLADGGVLARLPSRPGGDALARVSGVLAPKAAALTMFTRMFVADVFVHGVGGGRYDRVTDGVIRRFFGVDPPRYTVASMTMYLPLGGHIVGEGEVAAAEQRLRRLRHNPDQLLGEAEFESAEERRTAEALAEEKRALVESIRAPGADKKTLGGRIREVNEELAAMLAPMAEELRAERDRLAAMREATEVVTDRTYPFCFWSPFEIADKAR